IDDNQKLPESSGTEPFNLRTPDHIILAGQIGLGTWDARQIEHRRRAWDPIREQWVAGESLEEQSLQIANCKLDRQFAICNSHLGFPVFPAHPLPPGRSGEVLLPR